MFRNVTRVFGLGSMGGRELDRDRWRALVDTDMKLWAPQNAENSCTSSGAISS